MMGLFAAKTYGLMPGYFDASRSVDNQRLTTAGCMAVSYLLGA